MLYINDNVYRPSDLKYALLVYNGSVLGSNDRIPLGTKR